MRMILPGTLLAAACLAALTGCASADGQTRRTAAPRREAHPPVVFITFDELSTTSLVDARGRIDAVRYPNFAALARDGDWFPYATAPSDETGRALESLLTGGVPDRGRPPTYAANPRNLFTLLGRRYRIRASEEVTSLCPRRLCPNVQLQTRRSVRHELGGGRPERFAGWLRSVRATRKPTLFFKHLLLPHAPWRYLSSGRQYTRGDPIPDWGHAFFVPWVSTQKYQRHLLQLGFTDRLLGSVLARLKAQGLYERAIIVATADNGESFGRLGNGHEVTGRNAGDIALTPLLIKGPFQHDGAAPARHVRTADVLPTVARLAGVRPRWRLQGHSVYGRSARRIPSSATVFQRSGRRYTFTLGALRRWARAARRRKTQLFGSGDAPPGLYGIGPYRSLVGSATSGLRVASAGVTRAAINGARAFQAVRFSSPFVPAYVTGRLTRPGARPPRAVAVAINGRIAATSPTYRVHRGGPLYFGALVPESALQEGRNDVRIFSVSGPARSARLRAL
jgi:sulfatase-like protein